MRHATLDLSPDLFVEFAKFCKDGPPRRIVVKENPLPDDAEVVGVQLRAEGTDRYIIQLVIASQSFADVSSGVLDTLPELLLPMFETQYDEISENAQ